MKAVGTTLLEIVVLVAVGSALGLAGNALRSDGITLSKSYFAKPTVAPENRAEPAERPAADAVDKPAGTESDPPSDGNPDHIFQTITLEEIREIVHDPTYPGPICVFIDARGEEAYAESRIPYALNLNPYHADDYLPDVLPEALDAERVVVYCEGGKCEDSVFACRELLDRQVPYENIYLFEGGLEAWEKAGEVTDGWKE